MAGGRNASAGRPRASRLTRIFRAPDNGCCEGRSGWTDEDAMRNDRHVAASQPSPVLALVAAAALALSVPAAAMAQEVAHGVDVLLPPGYQQPSGMDQHPVGVTPSREAIDCRGTPRLIVVTAAPPPVPGWERAPGVEVAGLGHDHVGEVVVYSPAPEPMPGWRKLGGVDIRYHRIAEAPVPSRITTHSWKPD